MVLSILAHSLIQCPYQGITGCSLEGEGSMAFYECESKTTRAVVQQHEWLLVYMRECRLSVFVCDRSCWVGGGRIGLEEMGLLLRNLSTSPKRDKDEHTLMYSHVNKLEHPC